MTNLAALRMRLAEAKNDLRNNKADLDTVQAVVEYGATITGKNTEDRKREMAYTLLQNNEYQVALLHVRNSQNDVELLQAQVAAAEDEQAAANRTAVNHLADALTALAQHKPVDSVIVDAAVHNWYKK